MIPFYNLKYYIYIVIMETEIKKEKKYNPHYEKYRDTILKNARKASEKQKEKRQEEIALKYLREKLGINL